MKDNLSLLVSILYTKRMRDFLIKHPFLKNVAKIMTVIVISFATFVGCVVSLFMVLLFIVAVATMSGHSSDHYENIYGNKKSYSKLLSIPINGTILGDKNEAAGGFLSGDNSTFGYEVKKQIVLARNDSDIKGVLLEINSPGGTIYGSKAITDGVEAFRQATGKPIIAHVSGMAASGAYWTATSSDEIMADYGSLVGSIGVIFGPFKYYDKVLSENAGLLGGGVTTQNGIESFYFTAGKFKDFGNPYRRLSLDESRNAQDLVDNEYTDFVQQVSTRRSINPQMIKDQIGALIYDTKKAIVLHLIDSVGSKEDAYMRLATLAGLTKGDYQVVQENKSKGGIGALLNSESLNKSVPTTVSSLCTSRSLLSFYGDLHVLCP